MNNTTATPEVTTTNGRVAGFWRSGSAAFLGIPFAATPTGENRFAAPVRSSSWDGLRPAISYGATPQRRPFGPVTTIPEPSIPGDSTLNVNVFTPAPGDTQAKLPVFVWIHGGGYFAGSPASPWYDGASFNRDGVVTVTVSYRLGFDGFGWIEGAPLNRGILDQIAALEWVQENIAAFGGDPARVTIGGQSAGGGSVFALLGPPRTAGLFRSAISHSGPLNTMTARSAESIGRAYADSLGVAPNLNGWRTVSEDRMLDTQGAFNRAPGGVSPQASTTDVVRSIGDPNGSGIGLAFGPTIDGDIVMDDVANGDDIPLLLGSNANEFPIPSNVPLNDVVAALSAGGANDVAIDRFRAEVNTVGVQYAHSQVLVSSYFRAAVTRVAAARTAGGAGSRTWLYDFAFHSPVTGVAGHCMELPFAWDLLEAEGVEAQFGSTPPRALAEQMHSDWVAFIEGGAVCWLTAEEGGTGARRYNEVTSWDANAYLLESQLTNPRS